MKDLVTYTEYIIKNICHESELVKVELFESDEDSVILEVIVHNSDMANVIGKNGKMISAIRTLINAHSYLNDHKKVKINIDSF